MNKAWTLFLIVIAAALLRPAPAKSQGTATANATNRFTISGMHCDGCAGGLQAELKLVPGVVRASVTYSNKLAVVAFDTNLVNAAKLTATVKEAGFTAKPIEP